VNKQNQKFLVKITFWLLAEIWLNFVGLDNIADYSEYIFECNKDYVVSNVLLNKKPADNKSSQVEETQKTPSAVKNPKRVKI
jgi:hypothetical protein